MILFSDKYFSHHLDSIICQEEYLKLEMFHHMDMEVILDQRQHSRQCQIFRVSQDQVVNLSNNSI